VAKLADMMVGRVVQRKFHFEPIQPGEVILEVKDLTVRGKYKAKAVDGCSFNVRTGEIVGIAGVEGNGQTELVGAIMGMLKPTSGTTTIKGVPTSGMSTQDVMKLSVAHVPEDRALSGLVLDFSIAENSVLGRSDDKKYSSNGIMLVRKVNDFARRIVSLFSISTSNVSVKARNLSGGNQQKVIVGRELSNEPTLLIAHQPTRGLDLSSTEYIQTLLVDSRNKGRGVLLVSADFDEILDLSDRILVLYEGKIIGESKRGIGIAELGKMLGGVAT
jgi:ABC-type uncharacterized transport system ATPase subunit